MEGYGRHSSTDRTQPTGRAIPRRRPDDGYPEPGPRRPEPRESDEPSGGYPERRYGRSLYEDEPTYPVSSAPQARRPGTDGWGRAAVPPASRGTDYPTDSSRAGGLHAAEPHRTNGRDPFLDADTGSPRAAYDTGTQRRAVDDTGALRRASYDTGSGVRRRAAEDDTGSHRRALDDTGTRPRAVDDTTSGIRRRASYDTGTRPRAVDDTTSGIRRRALDDTGTGRRAVDDTTSGIRRRAVDDTTSGIRRRASYDTGTQPRAIDDTTSGIRRRASYDTGTQPRAVDDTTSGIRRRALDDTGTGIRRRALDDTGARRRAAYDTGTQPRAVDDTSGIRRRAGYETASQRAAVYGTAAYTTASYDLPSQRPEPRRGERYDTPTRRPAAYSEGADPASQYAAPVSAPTRYGEPVSAPTRYGEPVSAPTRYGEPVSAPAQYTRPVSAPTRYGEPVSAPAQYTRPVSAPTRYGEPVSAPAQYTRPVSAPAQYTRPVSAPAQYTRPVSAPAQYTRPVSAPARYAEPVSAPTQYAPAQYATAEYASAQYAPATSALTTYAPTSAAPSNYATADYAKAEYPQADYAPAGYPAADAVPRSRRAQAARQMHGGAVARGAPTAPVINHQIVFAVWLVGLAIAGLFWWQHTGPLDGAASMLSAAGRLVGLVAGYTLLTEILLQSRLPVLHRLGGTERMQQWHRDLGALLLVSMLAHAILLTQAYGMFDRLPLHREAWKLIQSSTDMQNAFVATGVLVAVGAFSVRAMRVYLPYELWHLLHRTTYIALFLGYGHQVAAGQDVSTGAGKAYWQALHLIVLAAVVWGRIVVPVLLNTRHRVRVAEVVQEGPDVVSVYLTGNRLDLLNAKSGQYLRWRFIEPGLWWQSHPFSLSAPPNDQWLRITVKAVGSFTDRLRELEAGTPVWISAPAGEHTADRRTTGKTLLIAAGSGIAPVRALLADVPTGAVVAYRAHSEEELILRDELESVARARGATLWYVVGSRHEPGPRRLLTARGLAEMTPDVAERDVYVCGPPGFTATITAGLRQLRVPAQQVHVSAFEL